MVGRTCLYLAGCFILSHAACNLVSATLRKMLAFTLASVQLPDESWGDDLHSGRSKRSELSTLGGFSPAEALGVRHQVGWIGHILCQSS